MTIQSASLQLAFNLGRFAAAVRGVLVKLRVLEARVVTAPSVVAAVAALHKAVDDLEAVAMHHTGVSDRADRAIAIAAAAKLAAEQEVAAARKVASNLKALLS